MSWIMKTTKNAERDEALRKLDLIVPPSQDDVDAGTKKCTGWASFINKTERQTFISNAYTVLTNNAEDSLSGFEVKLNVTIDDTGRRWHAALSAVNKQRKVARSISSPQSGDTPGLALAALVDTVAQEARAILSRSNVGVAGPFIMSTIQDRKQAKTEPDDAPLPFDSRPSQPRLHADVSSARNGKEYNKKLREPTQVNAYGRQRIVQRNSYPVPQGQPAAMNYRLPGGYERHPMMDAPQKRETVERHSLVDVLAEPAAVHHDPRSARAHRPSTGALRHPERQRRSAVEQHAPTNDLLQPWAVHSGRVQPVPAPEVEEGLVNWAASFKEANDADTKIPMADTRPRAATLFEEVIMRQGHTLANPSVLQAARGAYPVSGPHHRLYHQKDGDGPPVRLPSVRRHPRIVDPNQVLFQGEGGIAHTRHLPVPPPSHSRDVRPHGKVPEMVQRPVRYGSQSENLEGPSGTVTVSAQGSHNGSQKSAIASSSKQRHHHDDAETIAEHANGSSQSEYGQRDQTVTTRSVSSIPDRYRHRRSGAVMSQRAVLHQPVRRYQSAEAIITSTSKTPIPSSNSAKTKASATKDSGMDIRITESSPPITHPDPRITGAASPILSDFGGIEPVAATRIAPDPGGRPVARIESMNSIRSQQPVVTRRESMNSIRSQPVVVTRRESMNSIRSQQPVVTRRESMNSIRSQQPVVTRHESMNSIRSQPVVDRRESMTSVRSQDSTALVAGDSTVPVVRLPPVPSHAPGSIARLPPVDELSVAVMEAGE